MTLQIPFDPRPHPARRSARLAATLAALLAATSGAAGASDWQWTVTPYAWATDVGVDVELDDRRVIDEEIPVEELLEDLDTILQVRLEAQKGAHGLFLDLFDVTLSDAASEISLPAGAGTATVAPEMGMTIAELGGLYDPDGDQEGFQILYGARILNERAEIDARFRLADATTVDRTYEVDDTLVDALVGIRYVQRFSSRWLIETRADVSKGGTDLTWSVFPAIGYAFGETERYTLTAGYRRMVVDYDTADEVDAEMTLSGVLVGLRVAF